MDIIIRNVDVNTDIQGIREAHGADDHWGSDQACFMSQKTRLENGFFIQVAVYNDRIVGHAEWVISDEPEYRFLYLGMLQINSEYQKRGIGTKFLESGVAYAREHNCTFLRTMPDIETGSIEFYLKNGFTRTKYSNSTLKLKTTIAPANNAIRVNKVPFSVIKTLPFMIGLYQHSSSHMWNVYNARSENDDRIVSSFRIGDSYINIGAFEPTDQASVNCWSQKITLALIKDILAVGNSLGYKYLNFCVLNESVSCFDTFDCNILEEHDIFIERYL